ncbi:hypothetical protein KO529_04695 [Arenibacter algicola]|uniref:DUF6259 domain-containing protein n=1 Tax=Arenibacter algicola TaxID=616991 RepID=UPI001C06C2D6|nr:DUF6259 domain-containing protein [Arenibacter algicola]MBU2904074.1 hypothetical protein [Arenibacter algicola]
MLNVYLKKSLFKNRIPHNLIKNITNHSNFFCMNKFIVIFLLFLNANLYSQAGSDFVIKTSKATLTLNDRNNISISDNKNLVHLELNVQDLWTITLVNKSNRRNELVLDNKSSFRTEKSHQKIKFYANEIKLVDIPTSVSAEFVIEVKNDAFYFYGNLSSSSEDWIIKSLEYPKLPNIKLGGNKSNIYWSDGLGLQFNSAVEFGESRTLDYPSRSATMPWYTINSDDIGIYVGAHDSTQHTTNITLSRIENTNDFETVINTPINEKEYIMPEFVVKLYEGSWHNAAQFYRSWYDENFEVANGPDWVINDTGWLLAILKQQNGNVMWPYRDIDKLCDIAERFNLTTIGLFGWAIGGHDRLYPNYLPDPLMGGERELKEAIKRAHARGIKIVIYANGKLIDTSTDYYKYRGIETIAFGADKKPRMSFYVKHNNLSPVIFTLACAGSELWRETMHDLALQAHSLGADGILYDQIGVYSPELCYSTYHDHKPGQSDSPFRLQMMREIREDLKARNPDFVVMTEASNNSVLREIDYTHGVGAGYAPSNNVFPDLYRYTFPELMATQRNPNPLLTKTDANFALLYGLKYEVEIRYTADVQYIIKGKTPNEDSYWNVNYPPDISKMQSMSMEESANYVHSLIEFKNTHGNFLKRGKFISDEGITIKGKDVIARGFTNDDELGVVVWNKNEIENRNFEIQVSGYKHKSSHHPSKQKVKKNSLLEPNSIRFLIFEKSN